METEQLLIRYGKSAQVWDDKENHYRNEAAHTQPANVHFAFIEDLASDRTLEIFYSIVCPRSATSCPIDDEVEEALFATIMESVRFYEPSMVKEDE